MATRHEAWDDSEEEYEDDDEVHDDDEEMDDLSVCSDASFLVERNESFKVLKSEDVVDQMNKELERVSDTLQVGRVLICDGKS